MVEAGFQLALEFEANRHLNPVHGDQLLELVLLKSQHKVEALGDKVYQLFVTEGGLLLLEQYLQLVLPFAEIEQRQAQLLDSLTLSQQEDSVPDQGTHRGNRRNHQELQVRYQRPSNRVSHRHHQTQTKVLQKLRRCHIILHDH